MDKNQKVIDTAEFKELIKQDQEVKDIAIRKQFTVETKVLNEDKRIIRFIASTSAVDRDRDTIDPMGWDTNDFRKNPVFLWCHDYKTPPIGRCIYDTVQDGKLIEDIQFVDPEELYPGVSLNELPEWVKFADMVYKMYKNGYLRAVSVGFMPVEWVYNEETGGVDFKKQSQLELSAVPVPSNPEALIAAGMEGIDTKLLKNWAEEVIKSMEKQQTVQIAGIKELEQKNIDTSVLKIVDDVIEKIKLFDQEISKLLEKISSLEIKSEASTNEEVIEVIDNEGANEDKEPMIEVSEEELEKAIKNAIMELTGKIL